MKNLHPRTKLTSLLAATCLALMPAALAVDPPPDGGYPGSNTAEGDNALFSLTTGTDNTVIGASDGAGIGKARSGSPGLKYACKCA